MFYVQSSSGLLKIFPYDIMKEKAERMSKKCQISLTQEWFILFPRPVNSQHLAFRPSNTKTPWYQHTTEGRKKGMTASVHFIN